MFNWRLLSADLCRDHATDGFARLALGRSFDLETRHDLPILNLTPLPLVVGGPYLRGKLVRSWLWEVRHLRAMKRPWSMLVSKYDPIERVSTVHIGTVTLPEVAERYARAWRGCPLPHEPMVL
jgi:hypothetical protein